MLPLNATFSTFSEKLFEKSGVWRRLRDMSEPRGKFNPCALNDLIYLCGGNAQRLEAFDVRTDRYKDLGQLPQISNMQKWTPSCFVADGVLHLLCANYIGRREADTWSFSELDSILRIQTWSQCPPVVYASKVYFVNYDGSFCWEFDLSLERVTKTIKIE